MCSLRSSQARLLLPAPAHIQKVHLENLLRPRPGPYILGSSYRYRYLSEQSRRAVELRRLRRLRSRRAELSTWFQHNTSSFHERGNEVWGDFQRRINCRLAKSMAKPIKHRRKRGRDEEQDDQTGTEAWKITKSRRGIEQPRRAAGGREERGPVSAGRGTGGRVSSRRRRRGRDEDQDDQTGTEAWKTTKSRRRRATPDRSQRKVTGRREGAYRPATLREERAQSGTETKRGRKRGKRKFVYFIK
ncbi:hypothetical protein NDU88_006797 [Pleurodeles waltl]|uniref:Uncharacterized protein n=1 Tax=Pleurodeles waltl TaxID=8319 RepID=A0AAV7VNM9_PLEWA|nr:hypothetical protein NDU88_006797 [Pleurodeles waltl]